MKKKILSFLTAAAVTLSLIPAAGFADDSGTSVYDDSRTFTDEQKQQQDAFESICDDYMSLLLDNDFVSLKTLMKNPADYGFEMPEPSFGLYRSDDEEDDNSEILALFDRLEDIDRNALTYQQQLDFDMVEANLEDLVLYDDAHMKYFSSALSYMNGMVDYVNSTLVYYDFESEQDAEDFLALAATADEFIKSACDFELERMENGFALSQHTIDESIAYYESILSADPSNIYSAFSNGLDKLSLTDSQKKDYLEKAEKVINEQVNPSFQLAIDTLKQIKEAGIEPKALCEYKYGSEYYNYLMRTTVGTTKTPEEINQRFIDWDEKYSGIISDIIQNNPGIVNEFYSFVPETEDPTEMLNIMIDACAEDFPEFNSRGFTVQYLPKELENPNTVAFYCFPQIDNIKNEIYVNGSNISDSNYLFGTLSHEGIPGHMYQINYVDDGNSNDLRKIIYGYFYTGVLEGWAEYTSSNYSPAYSGMEGELADLSVANNLLAYTAYGYIENAIHGLGSPKESIIEYLSNFGLDEETANGIYYLLLDAPGVYMCYANGVIEYTELREKAEAALGDNFNEKDFHRFLLDTGIGRFDIIEDYEDAWIEYVLASASTDTSESGETTTATGDTSETSADVPDDANPGTGYAAVLIPSGICLAAILIASRKRRASK